MTDMTNLSDVRGLVRVLRAEIARLDEEIIALTAQREERRIEKWEPHKAHEGTVTVHEIAVDGPPCLSCRYWRPITQVMQTHGEHGPIYDGVRLCQAPEMYHDFSCFKAKKGKAAATPLTERRTR